eukprot:15478539-Alexandrium_andersonii.AAC.1
MWGLSCARRAAGIADIDLSVPRDWHLPWWWHFLIAWTEHHRDCRAARAAGESFTETVGQLGQFRTDPP